MCIPMDAPAGQILSRLLFRSPFVFITVPVCKDFHLYNGDGEIRTLDPLLARQVLSQLSYAPILIKYF